MSTDEDQRDDLLYGIAVGEPAPLSAAYCAERSARCLAEIEENSMVIIGSAAHDRAGLLLGVADRWRQLAESMGTVQAMNRPRHTDDEPEQRQKRRGGW